MLLFWDIVLTLTPGFYCPEYLSRILAGKPKLRTRKSYLTLRKFVLFSSEGDLRIALRMPKPLISRLVMEAEVFVFIFLE